MVPKESQGIGKEGKREEIIFKQILSDYTFCACVCSFIFVCGFGFGFFVL